MYGSTPRDSVTVALFDMFSRTCDVGQVGTIIFLNFILLETWSGFEKNRVLLSLASLKGVKHFLLAKAVKAITFFQGFSPTRPYGVRGRRDNLGMRF